MDTNKHFSKGLFKTVLPSTFKGKRDLLMFLMSGQVLTPKIPSSINDTCIMYIVLKVSFTGSADVVV